MTPAAPSSGHLISRTTILIICGVLAGIMLSVQITFAQKVNVAASCLIGIFAFAAIDGGLRRNFDPEIKKLQDTRDMLNRRIEVQKAFLDSQVREMPDVAKDLRAKQKQEALEAAELLAQLKSPAAATARRS